jgi:AcrR family transcriptional regulator
MSDKKMNDKGDSPARRRPGGRSARVRAAVLGATLDELAAAGHANLSFEEIARRAGVHKTTIYRNWRSREELVREALLARSEVTVPVPDTGSLRDDLMEFARAIVANITEPEYEAIVRAVASEARTEGALGQAAQEFWRERLRLLRVIVLRGIDRGELASTVDPNVLLETLLGPLYLRLLITREPLDEAFLQLVVDQLIGRSLTPGRAPR